MGGGKLGRREVWEEGRWEERSLVDHSSCMLTTLLLVY